MPCCKNLDNPAKNLTWDTVAPEPRLSSLVKDYIITKPFPFNLNEAKWSEEIVIRATAPHIVIPCENSGIQD